MTIYHFIIKNKATNEILYESKNKKKDGYISNNVAEQVADDVTNLVLQLPKEECKIEIFPTTLN